MAETTPLLRVQGVTSLESSNLSLSAIFIKAPVSTSLGPFYFQHKPKADSFDTKDHEFLHHTLDLDFAIVPYPQSEQLTSKRRMN